MCARFEYKSNLLYLFVYLFRFAPFSLSIFLSISIYLLLLLLSWRLDNSKSHSNNWIEITAREKISHKCIKSKYSFFIGIKIVIRGLMVFQLCITIYHLRSFDMSTLTFATAFWNLYTLHEREADYINNNNNKNSIGQ